MRDKNLNLKKKKVFEVKWMTKNLHLSNIIKKRAGLKKQDVLQKKKQMLKRMKWWRIDSIILISYYRYHDERRVAIHV